MRLPIGPVNVIFEHGNTKRMGQHFLIANDEMMIATIVVDRVYGIGTSIDPVDALQCVVQC